MAVLFYGKLVKVAVVDKLCINLELKAHAYPDSPSADLEAWGRISVLILSHAKWHSLLEHEWDLASLAEWFAENQQNLCHGRLSIEGDDSPLLPSESLAQALTRLQSRDFGEEEDEVADYWYDALYNFRQQHSLKFALPGANIPGIIIGCNRGSGEISTDENSQWSYLFDMEDFCCDFQQQLRNIIAKWSGMVQNASVSERANSILKRLTENLHGCCR